ncbi:MAG: hypothetical protein C5B56_14380 [Proteobacteria bacterium]|nr:MAG: hypothetical protein C5B56_14380 [Pseudomonadota bacterium]
MKPARIGLHIDELVLEGFSPLDGRRIADAVRTELARLLAERGVPRPLVRGVSVEKIDAGEVRVSGTPRAIGNSLAAGLYKGLKG